MRYQKNGKIVAGSYDLQVDEDDFNTKEEYEERFDYLCSLSDGLIGAELVNYSLDLESSDITLEFSGNQVLRNFANSAFGNKDWTYRNCPKQITIYASSLGVTLKKEKT